MSGMYPRHLTERKMQAPPRKRRLVTYYMQPLSEQAGYKGPRRDGHRFGVNRILRVNDDTLLSAGRDGTVRRWDVSSMLARDKGGTADAPLRDGRGDRRPADIGGDGVDQTGENEPPQPLCTGIFASHTDWVTGIAVAAGRIMASSSNDGTLKLWDLAASGRAPVGQGGDRLGLGERLGRWGREGRVAEAPQQDGAVDLSGAANGTGAPGGEAGGMGFPPSSVKEGGANLLYNSPPPIRPTALATVAGHGDYVKCLTYAPQGGLLVSGGLDKRILLWNLERMAAPLMVLRTGDGDGMGAGALPSSASLGRVVNGPGGQDWGLGSAGVGSSGSKGMGAGGVSSVPRWGSGGPWFHVRDPSRVLLRPGVAAAGQGEVFELCRQNKGSVYCVDASVDAALVASGGTDRMIRLLDPRVGAGRVAKICKLDGHRDNVRCVRIDEGGTRVVSGSTDGTIRVWDVRQQCCLGVYELPGGSVWAMQPSPCDFDIYYSGGRGRRVYRTDFRTGESSLVCMTNSEVLDMALELGRGSAGSEQSMSMWLSSTVPDITLWGGNGGGGTELRTGRPATATTASAGKNVGPVDAGKEARGVGLEGGGGLLHGHVGTIRGEPGVVRHTVLNNRRHVLTEDDASPPNVSLWDVTKAKQIEIFPPGTMMEEKERALTEIIAVRPWFSIGTHLGTPLVSLSESTVFDGELYAVDARGERQTFLESPPPPQEQQEEQRHLSPAPRGVVMVTEGSLARGGGGGDEKRAGGVSRGAVGTKARSAQEEVKVNLGDAVLRGLFSRWIDQYIGLDGHGSTPTSRRGASTHGGGGHGNGNGGGGARHADNGSSYSSGDSDSEDSDHGRESDSESRSASPGSGLSSQASEGAGSGTSGGGGVRPAGRGGSIRSNNVLDSDFASGGGGGGGSGRAIGDETVLWVTETDLGGNGGMQRTMLQKRVGEFNGREGAHVIPHWVIACVLHGEFSAKEQPKVAFFLAPWIPPGRHHPPTSPSQQQVSRSGGGGGGGGGGEASVAGSSRGGSRNGISGGATAPHKPTPQRFTAPSQMLVSKVMAYVLSHEELLRYLGGDGADVGTQGGDNANPSPEDLVEVLCGDRVVESHLYVGAIEQHIWNPKAEGTLLLHYRSPWRSSSRLMKDE